MYVHRAAEVHQKTRSVAALSIPLTAMIKIAIRMRNLATVSDWGIRAE